MDDWTAVEWVATMGIFLLVFLGAWHLRTRNKSSGGGKPSSGLKKRK